MKQTLKMIVAPVALTLILSACGGGNSGTGNSESAKLATTDEAAYFSALLIASLGAESNSREYFDSGLRSPVTNCDPGSISYTPDTSTQFGRDGNVTFSQCMSSNDTEKETVNGSIKVTCTDSAQTATACKSNTVRYGDGADGTKSFDLKGSDGSNDPPYDFSDRVMGDGVYVNGSLKEFNGIIYLSDKLRNYGFTVDYDHVTSDSDDTPVGHIGVSPTSKSCPSGVVELGKSKTGDLVLKGAKGQTATFSYNSDDSILIALSDGTTHTYQSSELEDPVAFCKP